MDASFDKKKFKCKFDYCLGKAKDLADPSLQATAINYKRKLSSAMKAVSGQDISRIPSGKGYFATRKYDGEFALVFFDGANIVAIHPSGTVRSGLPCLDAAAKILRKAKVKTCVLAGEYFLADRVAESRALDQV